MKVKKSNLTAKQIERAKSKEKPYRLGDGGGLFLLVRVNSTKVSDRGERSKARKR